MYKNLQCLYKKNHAYVCVCVCWTHKYGDVLKGEGPTKKIRVYNVT